MLTFFILEKLLNLRNLRLKIIFICRWKSNSTSGMNVNSVLCNNLIYDKKMIILANVLLYHFVLKMDWGCYSITFLEMKVALKIECYPLITKTNIQ